MRRSVQDFLQAVDISAYSLIPLCRALKPLMNPGAGVVAMTYYGAEKVVPMYKVMGVAKATLEATAAYLAEDLGPDDIRVNCLSAGPVRTLAAAGIPGFRDHARRREPHAFASAHHHRRGGVGDPVSFDQHRRNRRSPPRRCRLQYSRTALLIIAGMSSGSCAEGKNDFRYDLRCEGLATQASLVYVWTAAPVRPPGLTSLETHQAGCQHSGPNRRNQAWRFTMECGVSNTPNEATIRCVRMDRTTGEIVS